MSFVTIVQKNTTKPCVYHGQLIKKCDTDFEICIVTPQGTHEVWTCHYDYWNLIE